MGPPDNIDHVMLDKHLVAVNMKRKKVVSNLDKETFAALVSDKANCALTSNATALHDLHVWDKVTDMNRGHYVAVEVPFACASASQLTPLQRSYFDTDFLCLKSS